MNPNKYRWIFPLLGLFAVAYVLRASEPLWMPLRMPCLFHLKTGLYCPGCGATRCVTRLIHGDLLGAVRANAGMVYALMWLLGWCIVSTYCAWKPRARPQLSYWWLWGSLIAWLVYVIVRNFPCYPWSLLAPR